MQRGAPVRPVQGCRARVSPVILELVEVDDGDRRRRVVPRHHRSDWPVWLNRAGSIWFIRMLSQPEPECRDAKAEAGGRPWVVFAPLNDLLEVVASPQSSRTSTRSSTSATDAPHASCRARHPAAQNDPEARAGAGLSPRSIDASICILDLNLDLHLPRSPPLALVGHRRVGNQSASYHRYDAGGQVLAFSQKAEILPTLSPAGKSEQPRPLTPTDRLRGKSSFRDFLPDFIPAG